MGGHVLSPFGKAPLLSYRLVFPSLGWDHAAGTACESSGAACLSRLQPFPARGSAAVAAVPAAFPPGRALQSLAGQQRVFAAQSS